MVKINEFPELSIIQGFKDQIDFYEHNGQIIARRWPDPPKGERNPRVKESNNRFRYFQKSLKHMHMSAYACWVAIAKPMNWSWHEIAYRYYSGNTPLAGRNIYSVLPPYHWPDRQELFWFTPGLFEYAHIAPGLGLKSELVLWVDRWLMNDTVFPTCSHLQLQLYAYRNFGLREHRRLMRGVWKLCGWDLTPVGNPRIVDLNPSERLEYPPVSAWRDTEEIYDIIGDHRMVVPMAKHVEYPFGPPIGQTVSAGPPFWFDLGQDVPSFPVGQLFRRNVTPLTPWGWHGREARWEHRSDDADEHEAFDRPFWWPPTCSQQWNPNCNYVSCPAFIWPRPRP